MKELWTSMNELEFRMGDMNGIAFMEVRKPEKPKSPKPTSPMGKDKVPQKKHITKSGK